jgi:hypothetical protein
LATGSDKARNIPLQLKHQNFIPRTGDASLSIRMSHREDPLSHVWMRPRSQSLAASNSCQKIWS